MRALLAIALAACTVHETRIIVVRDLCESRYERPAVQCASGRLSFDGCRWACRLEPVEQEEAGTSLQLGPDIEALQMTSLCAHDCEGK